MKNLPLAVFAYNRPSHLKRLLISLESSKVKFFNFFLDGPKNKEDKLIQDHILTMLKNSNFKTKIFKQKKNLGLARSMEFGLDYMSKKYSHFVVLEDDVVPYKNFFKFISLNLQKFENNDQISCICGYQLKEINEMKKTKNNSVLLDFFIPWGWATWSKNWINYVNERKKIFKENKINKKNYFQKFLSEKIKKKSTQIWTAKFILFNIFTKKKFIFPSSTLTKNIGFDGSGVNSKVTNNLSVFEEKKLKTNFKHVILKKSFQQTQYRILKQKLNFFY